MSWGLKAALAAFAVPCVEVMAATWRRAAGIAPGSDKERSRQMALQRWPDQAKYLGRKRDHGRAEAMLIAAYGAGTLKHGAGHRISRSGYSGRCRSLTGGAKHRITTEKAPASQPRGPKPPVGLVDLCADDGGDG